MTKNRRIDRLLSNLSARERALLCIRATLLGRSEDPYVRLTMPPTQVAEFNRMIARENGILHVLVPSVASLGYAIETARLRTVLLRTFVEGRTELANIADTTAIPAEMLIRTTMGEPAYETAEAVMDRVRDDCTSLWASLLAHREVAEEVAKEFHSCDVLPAETRSGLRLAGTELEALHAEAKPFLGGIELPSADEELLDVLRAGIRRDERFYLPASRQP